ncbi:MAG: hypothetical protein ACTTKO_02760 [Candidatus Limimorpha sp.]
MKNIVRKTMFVLAFLGLFTFAAPKQVKAADNPCHTIIVCCSENDCHYCTVCNMGDLQAAYEVLCGIHIED